MPTHQHMTPERDSTYQYRAAFLFQGVDFEGADCRYCGHFITLLPNGTWIHAAVVDDKPLLSRGCHAATFDRRYLGLGGWDETVDPSRRRNATPLKKSERESIFRRYLSQFPPDERLAWMQLGVTASCWRNRICEDFHDRVSDPEMARITMSTHKAISPLVSLDGVDWDQVIGVLSDGHRKVLDDQSVASVFQGSWATMRGRVAPICADLKAVRDPDQLACRLVIEGQMYGHSWYGSPEWPKIASGLAELAEGRVTAAALLHAPETLSSETWEMLIPLTYDVEGGGSPFSFNSKFHREVASASITGS